MPSLLLSSAIFGPVFQDPEVARLLDDRAYFRAMLEVEAALARAQAKLGVIPEPAALAIEAAAASIELDAPALAAGVQRDGVPTIELIAQLRAAVGPSAAAFVHHGATSQDIMDTATVLCVRRALAHLGAVLAALTRQLADLAGAHAESIMAARTHGQQALPTTFGLKVAGWALPFARHRERLEQLLPRFSQVQLGGAAGTLAALGPSALDTVDGLGRELGLEPPALPWHSARDALAEVGAWLALLSGSLGKMAQDVSLLGQSEVAEVFEAPHGVRGGSSSMPQKNNPMRSEQIVAVARLVAAQVSALHQASIQEHERGTHGWQLEWLTLSPMLALTGAALQHARRLAQELVVDTERMRRNLLADAGLALGEAAVVALSAHLPMPDAQALVRECAVSARAQGRFLIDVVRERLALGPLAHRVDWAELARPEAYLGQARPLLERALARLRAGGH